jgi:cation diffusion facilitator CzcD-associated flavoprotein CzcO
MHTQSKEQRAMRDAVANRMADQLGHDPLLTSKMTPSFPLGCRRMVPGADYLQSLTKPKVQVLHSSAVRMTEHGVVDESGTEHKVDVVICATGFDVSFTPHFEVIGRNGANLKEQFGDFPQAYLSITVPNFPNLFRESPGLLLTITLVQKSIRPIHGRLSC